MVGQDDELSTFKRLITETYPKGIVSIVSDTWNFWKVINEYAPALKDEIFKRQGKVVFRPDSGDPIKIICGDSDAIAGTDKAKGAVECLWEHFGGFTNAAGFKELDHHVGLIYGDSITIERADTILARLKAKGFSASNVVFGVGSYTYQYATRDTFGMAVKSTYGEVNGIGREIFKDPITDSGLKKSAKGLLKVFYDQNGHLTFADQQTWADTEDGELRTVFHGGSGLQIDTTLGEVRKRLNESCT
jgi:nicotinamide phosphoribosyltransferase